MERCGWAAGKLGSSAATLFVVALGALASPREGAAQEAPALRDPLGRIAAEALHNNLGIAQERLVEARARAGVKEARGRFLPTLTLESRNSRQSGTVDLGDFVNPVYAALNRVTGTTQFPTDLSLTIPLQHESRVRAVLPVVSARIAAGYSASRHGYRAQRAARMALERALASEAQASFLSVAAARSVRRVWESTVPLVQEGERVAQRLVDAGTATPDAIFRARAERSDVDQKLLEAREGEAAAARVFNRLLGRPLDAPVDTVAETDLVFPLDFTQEEAERRALAEREELDQLAGGIAASQAGVRAATASFLPEVALIVDYGVESRKLSFSREDDFWTASLLVTWNVFNGGQDAARREAARADVRRLRLQREETEDLVRLEVRQAYQAARVARDAIGAADARLSAAEHTFTLVRRRYEEGLATLIEYLDARTALTGAELNRVATVYSYAIRWVDLERAAALRDIESLEALSWN